MKNVSKKLGVDTQGKVLTPALCMMKVRKLRAAIKAGKFKEGSQLRRYAIYYANWYTWKAKVVAKRIKKQKAAKARAKAKTSKKAA